MHDLSTPPSRFDLPAASPDARQLRVVYFGIPEHLLWLLSRGVQPVGVVLTSLQEDDTDLALEALRDRGIPLCMGKRVATPEFEAQLRSLAPDLLLSMHFDRKIPAELLAIPRLRAINVHPSLLPEYRGANPYYWVIRNGERETGVTVHDMTERFDEGDILLQQQVELWPDETLGSLWGRLGPLCRELALTCIERCAAGTLEPQPQPEGRGRKAPRVRGENLTVDLDASTAEVMRQVRAASPYFGVRLQLSGGTIIVYRARALDNAELSDRRDFVPGMLLESGSGNIAVTTRDGAILLEEVGSPARYPERLAPREVVRYAWGQSQLRPVAFC